MEKKYFHVDLDAFFASVEQRDFPQYKGKPLIVGGLPRDRRSVVSTASYEARKYGVHSGMPIAKAFRLCPNAVFLRGNHKKYQEASNEIMSIFNQFSPDVRQLSIDEASLDMTGTEKLFGTSEEAAYKIKQKVKEKTKLSVSIGVASTMYVAKIASGLQKPNGLTIVPFGKEEDFMLSLSLEKLWGAGEKTLQRLHNAGFYTTKDIYDRPLSLLQALFGNSMGSFLYNSVRGNKDFIFGKEAKNHSISTERTFEFDLTDIYAIETALMELCEQILYRLHKENSTSYTVALKIRYEDFTTVSVQATEDYPVSNVEDLFDRCKKLFAKKYQNGKGVRLLGLSCDNVEPRGQFLQGNLFNTENEKRKKIEQAIYTLQDKHPEIKIRKARLLSK